MVKHGKYHAAEYGGFVVFRYIVSFQPLNQAILANRASDVSVFYSQPTATVTVSDKAGVVRDFFLHQALLIQHSGFFKGAFSGGFRRSRAGRVRLEVESYRTFGVFAKWMYRGTLPTYGEWPHKSINFFTMLTHVYILADQLLVPRLKQVVIEHAIRIFKYTTTRCIDKVSPTYSDMALAFSNLPEGSPFLQFVVHVYITSRKVKLDDENDQLNFAELPTTALYMIVQTSSAMLGAKYTMKSLKITDYGENNKNSNSEGSEQEASKRRRVA